VENPCCLKVQIHFFFCDFLFHDSQEVIGCYGFSVFGTTCSNINRARLRLLWAQDQHKGQLVGVSLGDFCAYFFVRQVATDTKICICECGLNRACVIVGLFAYREYPGVFGREPEGHISGVVLDKNSDKAFEGAQDCAVNHNGCFFGVVFVGVNKAKSLGHREIKLNGTKLPGPFEAVFYMKINLWSVECAIARVDFVLDFLVL